MLGVFFLVLPLFGIIFLGYVAGRVAKLPVEGLAWLNFFVIYLALPALFFRLLSRTPLSEFGNFGFIATTTFSTLLVFSVTFFIAGLRNGGNVGEAAIQGFGGAYGNIGYLGPPLALAAFGPQAGVPVALIFCFDNSLHFTLAPLLMAFHQREPGSGGRLALEIARRIFTHPFILATLAGVGAAALKLDVPAPAAKMLDFLSAGAAPCALFAMGVTAALRPLQTRAERTGLSGADETHRPSARCPDPALPRRADGQHRVDRDRRHACGIAERHQCLRPCPAIWRLAGTRVFHRRRSRPLWRSVTLTIYIYLAKQGVVAAWFGR